ncbi:hypothetical protein TREMEDRAFT_13664, partial [Tremella mesenterica DSM 1558]|uniref:uncharacterized protein n=1 Tax=Tremella mesenterica (strain ATCC 24925 / CBS 8224 / DSM 1558 / NBRC 9311 / NRRL Y-6157 / RJB 2259-6 / UBC 559-6) TaxID=578456 RepID=UPI00032D3AEA
PATPFPELKHEATRLTITSERSYSSFSSEEKWVIVSLGALASLFSPISTNIYVPAIPTLVEEFQVSSEKISLTVTIFLIFQAVTPAFWGTAADSFGRRPVYFITLLIFTLACVGTALCPTRDYWLLMLMRILQATGGSATVAIGTGVISDVSMPQERGKYIGVYNFAGTFSMALGPVLGGVFSGTLGWRSIFWFLVISCSVVLVPLILFLPETLRSLVGDGSIPPPLINCTPAQLIKRKRHLRDMHERGEAVVDLTRHRFKPWVPFTLLFQPVVLLLFAWTSLYYAEWYAVLTVFSTILEDVYGLNDIQIGLCYIANGVGVGASAFVCGRVMDRIYRKEKARVGGDHRMKPEEFRLEQIRFRMYPYQIALFIISCISFGWTIAAHTHIAAPIIFTFCIGTGVSLMTTTTIYNLDIFGDQGGAITASFNLLRCLMGAGASAVVQLINNSVGSGWTFVILSGVCLAGSPLPIIAYKNGPKWRRRMREKAKEEKEKRRVGDKEKAK